MGKKKIRKHQKEPNDSSHSSDDDNNEANSGKSSCPHVSKSVCLNGVKKVLKSGMPVGRCEACFNNKKDGLVVGPEFTADETTVVWMCLQCGNQGCGRYSHSQHALLHYKTPRSDVHALVINTSTWDVWCYDCDEDVIVDGNKKLLECVNFIRRHKGADRIEEQPRKSNGSSQMAFEIDTWEALPTSHVNGNNNVDNSGIGTVEQSKVECRDTMKGKNLTIESSQRNSPGAKNVRSPNSSASVSVPRVKGLCNLGNTCYFNAIMQNLSQSILFPYVLEQHCPKGAVVTLPGINCAQPPPTLEADELPVKLGSLDITLAESGPLTQALFNFFREVHSTTGSSSRNNVINPNQVLGQICKKAPQFRGSKQQDSHELLRNLMDGVRQEEIKRQKTAILKAFNLPDKVEPKSVDNEVRQKIRAYGRQANHTIVDKFFGGQLLSTVLCKECHISSQVFEPFLDLSLSIAEEKPARPGLHRKLSGEDAVADLPEVQDERKSVTSRYQEKKAKLQAKRDAKKIRSRRGNKTRTISKPPDEEKLATDSNESSIRTSKDSASCDASEQSDADVEDNAESESTATSNHCCDTRRSPLALPCSTDVGELLIPNSMQQELTSTSPIDLEPLASSETVVAASTPASDTTTSPVEDICSQLNIVLLEDGSGDGEVESQDCGNTTVVDDDLEAGETDGLNCEPSMSESERLRLRHEWVTRSLTTLVPRYQPAPHECSVLSCLNQFTAPELLTGNNKFGCESCSWSKQEKLGLPKVEGKKPETVYSNASKQLLIFSPPAILTLHLKRFQQVGHTLRKVSRHVTFPLLLDLAPFCSSVCVGLSNMQSDQTSILYSLYGIVEHSGRLASGHYTAYVKVLPDEDPRDRISFLNLTPTGQYEVDHLVDEMVNSRSCSSSAITGGESLTNSLDAESAKPPDEPKPGKWYYVSDSSVSEVNEANVLQSQAYILFYERIF